jgi:hypothetical protein
MSRHTSYEPQQPMLCGSSVLWFAARVSSLGKGDYCPAWRRT